MRDRRTLFLTFGMWKLVGMFLLGSTIQSLIPAWEGADSLRQSHDLLRAFHNWDGFHYLRIATQGYAEGEDRVFYPLFPLLLRGFMTVFGNPVVAGLILTTVLSILFALVYYRFAGKVLSDRYAGPALLALIAMPSALFMNCLYTESLFLLLLFLFFWFFFERSWTAGVFAMLLTITRGQGMFVGVAVALILLCESPRIWRTKDWARAAYLVGIGGCFVAAFLGFMAYDYWAFGDPLEFIHTQTTHYGSISGFSLANSFRPRHILDLLTTMPVDVNGPTNGLLDRVCIYASIALAPFVWRLDRHLFAFYFCLAYFPATMGQGASYFRYFLLPWSIAAFVLARAYVDRHEILGVAKERAAAIGVGLGFTTQAGLSLLFAASRWVG